MGDDRDSDAGGASGGTVHAALDELHASGRGDDGDRCAVRGEEAADVDDGGDVAGGWPWDDHEVRLPYQGGLHFVWVPFCFKQGLLICSVVAGGFIIAT
jgi:hypothetical protein